MKEELKPARDIVLVTLALSAIAYPVYLFGVMVPDLTGQSPEYVRWIAIAVWCGFWGFVALVLATIVAVAKRRARLLVFALLAAALAVISHLALTGLVVAVVLGVGYLLR